MTDHEQREIDLINAVAAEVRQHATAGTELAGALPPGEPLDSMTARTAYALALSKIVIAQLATIDASLNLADWWATHPSDPYLVSDAAVAADLEKKAAQLDRDRYTICRADWRGRLEQAASDLLDTRLNGEAPWRAAAAVLKDMTDLIGPLRSAAQNFATYVNDRANDQLRVAFEQAARQRKTGIEVRITERSVMPDGGIVTTRDDLVPPASNRR